MLTTKQERAIDALELALLACKREGVSLVAIQNLLLALNDDELAQNGYAVGAEVEAIHKSSKRMVSDNYCFKQAIEKL